MLFAGPFVFASRLGFLIEAISYSSVVHLVYPLFAFNYGCKYFQLCVRRVLRNG